MNLVTSSTCGQMDENQDCTFSFQYNYLFCNKTKQKKHLASWVILCLVEIKGAPEIGQMERNKQRERDQDRETDREREPSCMKRMCVQKAQQGCSHSHLSHTHARTSILVCVCTRQHWEEPLTSNRTKSKRKRMD